MNEIIAKQTEIYKDKFDIIIKKIQEYNHIAIFRHIMPDFDALGCQFGLYNWLRKNFPDKDIKVLGDNHVTFTPAGLYPETDKVNDSWFNEPFLGIVLDVGDYKRIADPRFSKANYLIKLDHHPETDTGFDLKIVDTALSAAGELIANMLIYFETKYGYELDKDASSYLYNAIVGDNGRFLYNSTSRHSFEIASYLLNKGINIVKIYEKMYEKSKESLNFMRFVLNNFHITPAGTAYYVVTEQDEKDLGIACEQVKENVNLFSSIKGVKIWCSLGEDVTGPCFRISLRSRYYDVSQIARKYKGGGHISASGAQIETLDKLDDFINDCDKVIEAGPTVDVD